MTRYFHQKISITFDLYMPKKITIFNNFEEQEMFYLRHYYNLSKIERLRALADLQRKLWPVTEQRLKRRIQIIEGKRKEHGSGQ